MKGITALSTGVCVDLLHTEGGAVCAAVALLPVDKWDAGGTSAYVCTSSG